MKVLVTGGTGFIGRHLINELLRKGYFCRCLVRKSSDIGELKQLNIELVYGDILNPDSLRGIAKDINVVYHLAAEGHVSALSKSAYQKCKSINVEGTRNLAVECCKNKIKKFIHFSSTAAMGLIKDIIVNEETPCVPKTPYQKTKYESEQVVIQFWKEHKLPAIIVRPSMVYGEGGTGEFLRICRFMKKGIFPKLGNGKKLTPLVYIDNLIQGTLLVGERGITGQTYLIIDHSVELDRLRKLILSNLGVKRFYPYVPPKLALALMVCLEKGAKILGVEPLVSSKNIESTIADRVFDTSRARDIGFKQIVPLEEAVKRTINWYKGMNYL